MTNEEYEAIFLDQIKKIQKDTLKLVLITISISILVFVCLFYGGKKLAKAHENYNIAQAQITMQENAKEGDVSSEESGNTQETKEVTKISSKQPFPLELYIVICFLCALFWAIVIVFELVGREHAKHEFILLFLLPPDSSEQ